MRFLRLSRAFLRDRNGTSAIEYTLIISIAGLGIYGAFLSVQTELLDFLNTWVTAVIATIASP